MSIADWIMILAVFLGPVAAVTITRYLDDRKEIRERKINIFKTLMTTRIRIYQLSWAHVEALNRIYLEFDIKNKKEKAVIEAWKAYFDQLHLDPASSEQWDDKCMERLIDLLHKMALVLNYDFDKTHIKNSFYSPIRHDALEADQDKLRKYLIEVLEGERKVPMSIDN